MEDISKKLSRRQVLARLMMMTGGALSAPLMSAVLTGVTADDKNLTDLNILSESEMTLVSAVAETIIPTTDTPGAIEAGVPHFIHLMLARWYKKRERDHLLAGLRKIEEKSLNTHGASFSTLSNADKTDLLLSFDTEAFGEGERGHFFRQIKELTLVGYYTSEIGATQELRYESVPGPYEGCIPFSTVGRTWAL